MAMTDKEKKQLMVVGIVVALAAGGLFFQYKYTPDVATRKELTARIDTLQAKVDSARAILEQGRSGALEARKEDLQSSLALMRELVPTRGEVTVLLDDIVRRAGQRGLYVDRWTPGAVQPIGAFQASRNEFTVYGSYDQFGEFLSDIASLPRIMVTREISLSMPAATPPADWGLDTTVTSIKADFVVRAFVKDVSSAGSGAGDPGVQ